MKPLLAAAFLALLGLVAFGMPGIGPDLHRLLLPGTEQAVLPMRFAHNDHFGVACTACHHEFVDGTTGPTCIACHLTDPGVQPLFQQQFHQLCRSCHVERQAAGAPAGPTRRCIACHQPDPAF